MLDDLANRSDGVVPGARALAERVVLAEVPAHLHRLARERAPNLLTARLPTGESGVAVGDLVERERQIRADCPGPVGVHVFVDHLGVRITDRLSERREQHKLAVGEQGAPCAVPVRQELQVPVADLVHVLVRQPRCAVVELSVGEGRSFGARQRRSLQFDRGGASIGTTAVIDIAHRVEPVAELIVAAVLFDVALGRGDARDRAGHAACGLKALLEGRIVGHDPLVHVDVHALQ